MRRRLFVLCATFAFVACAQNPAVPPTPVPTPVAEAMTATPLKIDAPTDTQPLTVMTHDSFAISPETLAAFEAQHHA